MHAGRHLRRICQRVATTPQPRAISRRTVASKPAARVDARSGAWWRRSLHRRTARPFSLRTVSTRTQDDQHIPEGYSFYDETNDWQQWFRQEEYLNPWSSSTLEKPVGKYPHIDRWPLDLEPLPHARLDNQTRFTLQLLQELYNIGLTGTADRITTERCNAAIAELANNRNFQHLPGNRLVYQRAERAYRILRTMHGLYYPLHQHFLRNDIRSPVQLPLPNQETYFLVLRLHASSTLHGESRIPQRCEQLVHQMEEYSEKDPRMRPHAVHWNQVLAAWSNSRDPSRSIEAAQLLQRLDTARPVEEKAPAADAATDASVDHLDDDAAPANGNVDDNASSAAAGSNQSITSRQPPPLTDESSFAHALQACTSLQRRAQDADSVEMLSVAFRVAGQLWKALQAHQRIRTTSFHYAHYLRSCRNLANASTSSSKKDLEHRVLAATKQCIDAGKFNIHILQEFRAVAPDHLKAHFFGPLNIDEKAWRHDDSLAIVKRLPESWFFDADGKKYTW